MKTNEELAWQSAKDFSFCEYPFTEQEWEVFKNSSLSVDRYIKGFLAACELKDKEIKSIDCYVERDAKIVELKEQLEKANKDNLELKKVAAESLRKYGYFIKEILSMKEDIKLLVIAVHPQMNGFAQKIKNKYFKETT